VRHRIANLVRPSKAQPALYEVVLLWSRGPPPRNSCNIPFKSMEADVPQFPPRPCLAVSGIYAVYCGALNRVVVACGTRI